MKKYLLLGLTLLGTVGFAHEITGNGYDDTFDYPSYEPSEKVQKYANSAYEFYEEVGEVVICQANINDANFVLGFVTGYNPEPYETIKLKNNELECSMIIKH